jgi:hypothetical protein
MTARDTGWPAENSLTKYELVANVRSENYLLSSSVAAKSIVPLHTGTFG